MNRAAAVATARRRKELRGTLGDPKTTDYCKRCGESPESASHGPFADAHEYVDPRGVTLTGDDPDLVRRGPPRRR